ncbi:MULTISPECIES: phage tail tube protein [Phaeobacter]|uniref:Phage tail protein n=1 Tax=Phaeobacter inhibens TaxID=221822 RepID=A0A2I7KHC0_9RHOB|nr:MULTISPECIES: phage tail tube protein [Phaeobacter]AUR01976.1 hypothetical protein PhaeoP88_04664 [Phaeobacter inhibens]AUR38351.1 hypothetical protein PhaeoP18_04135 [Phaeobacter piscinae]
MSSSGAIRGKGSSVRVGVGDPVAWTKLAGIESFDFPDQSRPELDVTHLDSPNDTEEAIPGMRPVAVWTVDMHHVEGSATEVLLSGLEDTGEPMQLELKTGGAAATPKVFAGYVKGYTPKGIGPKGVQMAALSILIQAKIEG